MADIEERAEKWAETYCRKRYGVCEPDGMNRDDLVAAYLAGASQAQSDYAAHFLGGSDADRDQ